MTSVAIAALVLLAPSAAHGMTEIGAVEEPVPVRVFPIAGPHDLGRSPTNRFGGGRGHNGQDMFAACGTKPACWHKSSINCRNPQPGLKVINGSSARSVSLTDSRPARR